MTGETAIAHRHIPLDRVSVLIDSIYAFAMTLLVITIDVPSKYSHMKATDPVHAIVLSILPDLIHFFIAFILLAILWYFEHQRFLSLRYLNRPLLCLNMASLAFVCLLPFSTNVAGDYPFDHLGAIIFELNIFVIGMIALIQWIYIRKRSRDFVPDMSPSQISREIIWSTVFPALSLMGIVLAVFLVPYSLSIYIFVPIIMAFLFWKDPV
jgi:uncharacterized membrane protein